MMYCGGVLWGPVTQEALPCHDASQKTLGFSQIGVSSLCKLHKKALKFCIYSLQPEAITKTDLLTWLWSDSKISKDKTSQCLWFFVVQLKFVLCCQFYVYGSWFSMQHQRWQSSFFFSFHVATLLSAIKLSCLIRPNLLYVTLFTDNYRKSTVASKGDKVRHLAAKHAIHYTQQKVIDYITWQLINQNL